MIDRNALRGIALGTPVIVTGKLVRKTQGYSSAKKYWDHVDIPEQQGLYIGVRKLSNGHRSWEGDEVGFVYDPDSFFFAALVVFSPTRKPILVPLDRLKEANQ